MLFALLLALAAPVPADATPPLQQAAAAEDRAALEALNRDWLTAYKTRDTAALDRILAEDFEAIYPGGQVLRKADILKSTGNPDRSIEDIRWDGLKIMIFGDVAMVSARSSMKGTAGGTPFAGSSDYADIYVKRGGKWRAVSAHVVRVTQPQP